MNQETEVKETYEQLIKAWNDRNAERMAELFTDSGELIGFDGSLVQNREEIVSHLQPIFENHPTPPFIHKVKEVKFLGEQSVLLRAIAGMVTPGEDDINPEMNTHHTLVLIREKDEWKVELFQNTPAQFHGRPELVEEMTNELKEQSG
ncbi:SgcJ/EcaC family oxidoreductase [Salimicrobium flavidum]|uniref:SnoaL-like domain-containing protein n=1 Tax=Salimicrobium flavidum TaxID=570947 RepID=A0A1N7KPC0_9BACI|nr:SgcJ/EcaC family oxidoreductase [Salimicrobium flavidum]SIS63472.1 conserved hypothetical protein [Salimicrobium flavidum]